MTKEEIRRAMAQFEAQGIACHFATPAELAQHQAESDEYDRRVALEREQRKRAGEGLPNPAKPFLERVKDMERVRRTAQLKSITIRDACDEVGISFALYRKIKAAHDKGKTKYK